MCDSMDVTFTSKKILEWEGIGVKIRKGRNTNTLSVLEGEEQNILQESTCGIYMVFSLGLQDLERSYL